MENVDNKINIMNVLNFILKILICGFAFSVVYWFVYIALNIAIDLGGIR